MLAKMDLNPASWCIINVQKSAPSFLGRTRSNRLCSALNERDGELTMLSQRLDTQDTLIQAAADTSKPHHLPEDRYGAPLTRQPDALDMRSEQSRSNAENETPAFDYSSIFERAAVGIFQSTPEGRYLKVNPALANMYRYESTDALIDAHSYIATQLYVAPGRREDFERILHVHDTVSNFESEVRRKDGTTFWISEHARAVRDASGCLLYYEGFVEDISNRRALEAEREQVLRDAINRADHDPLTGLLNHRAFYVQLDQQVIYSHHKSHHTAVAVFDLDNFKYFNDIYGHAVGDEVLRSVAGRIQSACRDGDFAARIGGDEFAMFIRSKAGMETAAIRSHIAQHLNDLTFTPSDHDTAIPIAVSIGVALFEGTGVDCLETVARADESLRFNKGGKREAAVSSSAAIKLKSNPGFHLLDALIAAVDSKDRYTRRHAEEVLSYSIAIARRLGLSQEDCERLETASLLHDVGKIGVPDRILRKPGVLTEEEYATMQRHPDMGVTLVSSVSGLEDALDAIRYHHEHWDGSGYPGQLAGDKIPLLARIIAVADAYTAMVSDRPFRRAFSTDEAVDRMIAGSSTQWDPICVAALIDAIGSIPTP